MALKFVEEPTELYPNILLYGPAKSGKSTAAASWPGDKLFLNLDTPNALHYAREHHDGIRAVTFEGKQTLSDIARAVEGAGRDFAAVVVDPIGDLHRRLLEEASNRAVRPSLQDYGDVAVMLERWCRFLCEMPVTAIFVAHDNPIRNEETGELVHLPATGTSNPALGQKLLGMVDIVGYSGTVQPKDGPERYVAQLRHGKGRIGGDRFGVLEPVMTLDLEHWYNLIVGHQTEQSTKQEALR